MSGFLVIEINGDVEQASDSAKICSIPDNANAQEAMPGRRGWQRR